jgi:truncated hemoglobin YjbI
MSYSPIAFLGSSQSLIALSSSNKQTNKQTNMVDFPVNYKENLLERIGGASSLDFLVISYCERIQDDPNLKQFYGNFNLKSLTVFQKELVMAALVKPDSEEDAATLKARVALRHYRLFELGLNESDFDTLVGHFSGALRDCWLTEDVVELCETYFTELRPIFKENGKSMQRNAFHSQDTQDRLSESMRETKARNAVKDFDRLCKSEEFQLPANLSEKQPKKKTFFSFLQTNKRKV